MGDSMNEKEDFEVTNHKHEIIACSSCERDLVDVWITRPDFPVLQALRASCPFCEDQSYIIDVQGGFHLGPCDGVAIASCDTDDSRYEDKDFYFITTSIGAKHDDSQD